MPTKFALHRRLFRMITCEVTQVEGIEALRAHVIIHLPKEFNSGNLDQRVAAFLIANRASILIIPAGILSGEQRQLLLSVSVDDFRLEAVSPSSLLAIVRYLLPFPPGPRPDPSNSLWKTRLKLLSGSGAINNFVRLWRLWNKYQHKEHMKDFIPEIKNDFEAVERAMMIVNPAASRKKFIRFRRLMNLIENESEVQLLKDCVVHFEDFVSEFHRETSKIEDQLKELDGLKLLLSARK